MIKAVGVELEGGWDRSIEAKCNPRDPFPNKGQMVGDGSVRVSPEETRRHNISHIGEVISPKLAVADVEAWMRYYYPAVCNKSCGLHVHISFTEEDDYEAIVMDSATRFVPFLIRVLQGWGRAESVAPEHPFWVRVNGGENYCKYPLAMLDPKKRALALANNELREWTSTVIEQMRQKGKGGRRYYAVNHAKNYHGTIEIRTLPMFESVDTGVKAVQTVIETTAEYLDLHNTESFKRELREGVTIAVPLPRIQKNRVITIGA